jgi:hypothetical protein
MKLEKKVVGLVATILLVLSVAVCGIFLGIPDLHVWAQQKQLQYATQVEKGESVLSLMQAETAVLKEGQQDIEMQGQLRLEIPEEVKTADVSIEQNYVDQEVRMKLIWLKDQKFAVRRVLWCSKISSVNFSIPKLKTAGSDHAETTH